ncbi:MAG: hypothetical protein JHC26_01475 [Thermofilum sp.]|jgi:hypothetical protein|uniref:hypothetical protein n=1 Tax=Thermofilum sp. TaxID=1961369 RepID=UPI00258D6DA7|nr:hypothetical protein [Thermofilum sp.]MCI4407731.1 hypothetical protein [Thermofilum sp.]
MSSENENKMFEKSILALMHLAQSIEYGTLSRLEYAESLKLLGASNDPKDLTIKLNQALKDIETYLGHSARAKVQDYLTWTSRNVKDPQNMPLDKLKEVKERSHEILVFLEKKLIEKRAVKIV